MVFWDETQGFSETPAFSSKSTWKSPKGHSCLEIFLSYVEHELFKITKQDLWYSKIFKGEPRAIRSLADNRSIVIKKLTTVRSCVAVWGRNVYVLEAEKKLSNPSVYRDVSNSEKILPKLSETSSKMFRSLRRKGFIIEQLKHFTNQYKKATDFGKIYLLPKIHINDFLTSPGDL